MIESGQVAPPVPLISRDKPALLVFFETDCPTCQLTLPYLNALNSDSVQLLGISQDAEAATQEFVRQLQIKFPVEIDRELQISRAYDPQTVPTIFLVDNAGKVQHVVVGFDKAALN